MPQLRHVARAVVSTTAVTACLAFATPAWAASTVPLQPSNQTAASFENKECKGLFTRIPPKQDGWYFSLPSKGEFLKITLEFSHNGGTETVTVPNPDDEYEDYLGDGNLSGAPDGNGPTRRAYVFTPAGWTLVSGSADINGAGGYFELVYTCPATPRPEPTPTATATATATATPTPTPTSPAPSPTGPTPVDPTPTPTPSDPAPTTSDPAPTPSASDTPASDNPTLPVTGATVPTILLLGVALIATGAVLVAVRRRRGKTTLIS